jgi:hypothetical protein
MGRKWPLWRLAIVGGGGGAGYQLISFILNPLPPGVVGNALLAYLVGRLAAGALMGALAGALVAVIRNAFAGQKS